MLISIPGDPLRQILSYGDKRIEEANASQYNSISSQPGKQSPPVSVFVPHCTHLLQEGVVVFERLIFFEEVNLQFLGSLGE